VWRGLEATLPDEARDGSIVVVLGERLAGKTTLIRAALVGDPLAGLVPGGGDDTRLAAYTGRGQIVLEMSADLLADSRRKTIEDLDRLWREIALRGLRVVIAVNAASPAWSSEGLAELGRSVRRALDRASPRHAAPPCTCGCA
jgi:type II secretory pathway predicted ATPase ExeA